MTQSETPAWRPERRTIALNLTIDAMSGRVVTALHDAGVPSLLLKGPVIARRLYQPDEIRPYGDCDLLVRSRDLAVAEAAVARLGMVRDSAQEWLLSAWERHTHTWQLAAWGFELELHWTLIHVGAEPETLWSVCNRDATTMRVGGVDVRTPADPQLAVILALHAAQHAGEWSRPQTDLLRALDVFPPAVWRTAAQLAEELDARPAFSTGLRLIPSGAAMARALALPNEQSFEVWLTSGRAGKGAHELDRFVRARGPLAKARLVIETAFPPPARMRANQRLAARGRAGLALAYAMRAIRLAPKFSLGLRRWRRARREITRR